MAEDGDAAAKAEQALGRLHELCEMLRGGLSRAMELKRAAGAKGDASAAGSEKPSAAALAASTALLELKSVNRQVWELVDGFKSRTLAANRAIDEYDLRLNNLQYERNHFLREIKHCRDFGAESERVVDLIDEAEFDRSAPPELRTATPADDPHQYHLNRLELELRQRRSLCESRAARLSERSAREAANQKKKDFVEGLSSQINSLTTMSLPLQRLLGLRVSARYTERKRIALLPPALRALYVRVAAHRDTLCAGLVLEIVGDLEHAELILNRHPMTAKGGQDACGGERPVTPPGGRSGGGGGGGGCGGGGGGGCASAASAKAGGRSPRRHKAGGTPKRQRTGESAAAEGPAAAEAEEGAIEEEDESMQLHPLFVVVSLPVAPAEGGGDEGVDEASDASDAEGEISSGARAFLRLQFAFLPSAGLVGVRIKSGKEVPRPLGAALLDLLFEGDTGRELPPPPSTAGIPSHTHDALTPPALAEVLGALTPYVPYAWVQRISEPLPGSARTASEREDLVRLSELCTRVAARHEARTTLEAQLLSLAKGESEPPSSLLPVPLPSTPPLAQLQNWAEVRESELSAEARKALRCEPSWRAHGRRLFTATVSRADGRLSVTVHVGADYPLTTPIVHLRWLVPPARLARAAAGMVPPALAKLAKPAALRVAKQSAPLACDNQLRQLEKEVNSPSETFPGADGAHALLLLVHRLRVLTDVYLDTEEGGAAATGSAGVHYYRRVRGRDRRKPFLYDPATRLFDQN